EGSEKYRETGLRTVAAALPRYPENTNVEAVRETAGKYRITETRAVDTEHKLRDAFQNEHGYVPAYYLFDEQHKLKSFAAGEYGTKVMEPALERMLGAAKVATTV